MRNVQFERIRNVVRRHGVLGTLRLTIHTLGALVRENTGARRRERRRQQAFDKKYGVDTASSVAASALRVPDSDSHAALHAVGYQTTSIEAFQRVISSIPLRYEEFTFIDVGSGKGRALLLGSHYPFRRIIGVELSPRLSQTAQRNVAAYRDPQQRCRAIECVCIDASKYSLPAHGHLLLYLYNPFGEPVMRTFLERVREATASGGREIWLVYVNPTLRALLDQTGFLVPVQNEAGLCLYRVAARPAHA